MSEVPLSTEEASPADAVMALEPRQCQVWWARTADSHDGLRALLDPADHARLARLRRTDDRDRSLVGGALARLLLAACLGLAPSAIPIARTCPRCGGPHGKPRLAVGTSPSVEFSVCHSGERVAVAVTREAGVGVDVERLDPEAPVEAVAEHVLVPAEQQALEAMTGIELSRALLSYWTRKEAILKATGFGLARSARSLQVTGPRLAPRLLSCAWDPTLPGRLTLRDLTAGPDRVASLAVLGACEAVVARDGSALLWGFR